MPVSSWWGHLVYSAGLATLTWYTVEHWIFWFPELIRPKAANQKPRETTGGRNTSRSQKRWPFSSLHFLFCTLNSLLLLEEYAQSHAARTKRTEKTCSFCIYIYICLYVYMCICICVYVQYRYNTYTVFFVFMVFCISYSISF